ncbi:MAG: ATP-dependent DNA helicase RecG [Candidatus Fermentithermobacillus carboniphilus]|uniref:ATP-dependent DNA helicase RecG n=1 Tax=Candidatus Fermentithermobacillus carboniphilus TaxID=3085328 RepID=A0AAT9LB67_9FIRM|nr:MAG: ATP-dependent DNA helicase RecG [Candidatus Fermentithermobacillus carboniphilus]
MTTRLSLEDDVRYIKGVGPKKAQILRDVGVSTARDLLDYFPFRIEDFSRVTSIDNVRPGDDVTVQGRVVSVGFVESLRGKALRVGITDGRGIMYLVWYNMPYLYKKFSRGQWVLASGRAEWRRNSIEMAHPIWKESPGAVEVGPIIPVYHGKASLTSSAIHAIISSALSRYGGLIEETLPSTLRERYGLLPEREAYRQIHAPQSPLLWDRARKTFAFREVLHLQIALSLMKKESKALSAGIPFHDLTLPTRFLETLPFRLTRAQARVISEIREEVSAGKAMNRLVQGDVGSGKTVVAMWSLLAAVSSGYQGAFLVPTEVLARQHKRTFERLAGGLTRIGLLVGSLSSREKQKLLEGIASGDIHTVVGTHALLEPEVKWYRLGLVVTDEQHRFGVRQRLTIPEKAGELRPHILVMSATPIPRSLALTLYGDLDISVIDELPEGRKTVTTRVLGSGERAVAYRKVREEVQKGHQAYVVCPLIREGKTGRKAAEMVFEELKDGYLKGLRLGLIHGELSKDALDEEMKRFVEGKTDVLISTTVIEVGVDVENATCMVIEDADSFGLATLHQLRGRVGRGDAPSYCYLIASSAGATSCERLRALERLHDGFSVAELDLEQRGPGQFFGTKQHGLPEIKVQELGITAEIIVKAREEAERILRCLENGDAGCCDAEYSALLEKVRQRFGDLTMYARSR